MTDFSKQIQRIKNIWNKNPAKAIHWLLPFFHWIKNTSSVQRINCTHWFLPFSNWIKNILNETPVKDSGFFSKQIQEIKNSKLLRFYGAFLGLTHVLTFLHWNQSSFFVNSQRSLNSDPLCFPFFPNCDLFRALIPEAGWQLILFFYLLLSIITTLFFLKERFIKKAFFFLAITTLFKLILHLSNYNFTDDHHFMVHLVSFLYLFVPNKKINILFLIPAFYMAAGFSKINPDWLSGAISINTPWLRGNLLLFSLAYVILLESFLVLGLLSPWSWLRWITLSQLFLMHGYSWFTFGFYYPMIMFCLLSFFFLDDFSHHKTPSSSPAFPGGRKTISCLYCSFYLCTLSGSSLYPGKRTLSFRGCPSEFPPFWFPTPL